ncbi:S8 family peptidase [Robertmurraya kyonggiensis]|uniref:Peptidase S8 n=1 Tax=Robertmurraya kyonggiensis TaxID=1037680 RepID=A0A4U1CYV2_9BACI|nr:S8 family peptidase [Robertmurraya kyonggiensis]TKC14349.1 peptidase S8 [Robertmurraya kyonggiensis]
MKVKKILAIAIALSLMFLPVFNVSAAPFEKPKTVSIEKVKMEKNKYKSGELIIKFKDSVDSSVEEQTLNSIGAAVQPEGHVKSEFKVLKVKDVEKAIQKLENNSNIEYAEPNYIFTAQWTPNDTYYSGYQYGLQTTQTNLAWDVARGSSSQEIAVLDTGVDYTHPDLDGKVILGYDFVDNDNAPMDANGHGTHVAGIAAAETNNGAGISGTAPNTKVLAVRVLDAEGSGTLDDIAAGIRYAADSGAEVINMSLGCDCNTVALENAVNYAWNKGVVVVAAAGNDNTSVTFEPASYTNVIAVGAVNNSDRKASFSNYGTWVDVVAPGVSIASTYPGNQYVYMDGTSMASPYVAGLAALLKGQGRTNAQVRQAIELTADSVQGTGSYSRYGRINSNDAVRY